METANARVKAEMQFQEVQSQLSATRRTLKLRQKETARHFSGPDSAPEIDTLESLQAGGMAVERLLFHCYDSSPSTPEG